jgi:hypothetical protein
MARLQGPFFVAMLYPASETASDTAGVMLKVSDYLFDNDAPAGLIRDLLRVGQRVLQP